LVQEVATASREQAAGVAQVNQAMNQVDRVTQRNAAAAEQLSSTADEMASQADYLQQLMGMFKVKASDQSTTAADYAQDPEPESTRLGQRDNVRLATSSMRDMSDGSDREGVLQGAFRPATTSTRSKAPPLRREL